MKTDPAGKRMAFSVNLKANTQTQMRKAFPLALSLLLLTGCHRYSRENFTTAALDLRLTYNDWVNHGRSGDYQVSAFIQPEGTNLVLFALTNSFRASGGIHQCRFGARDTAWPKGMLAITEDGKLLWVRERDYKITLSPERYGVAP